MLANDWYEIKFPPENLPREHNTDPAIMAALLTHIEFLEAENTQLKATQYARNKLRIEDIQQDDKLVRFLQDLHHTQCYQHSMSFWNPWYMN